MLNDLTGKRFGRYEVLGRIHGYPRMPRWLCRCDCGTEKQVIGGHLNAGRIVSCGCWAADKARERATHGKSKSRTYIAWRSMLNRCYRLTDKRYVDYGGRGIFVCAEWRDSFIRFLADMGECPDGMQIDRRDNDGNYTKDNCRWTTGKVQANNRRTNVRYEFNGKLLSLSELSDKCGVNYKLLHWRLRVAGWEFRAAIKP